MSEYTPTTDQVRAIFAADADEWVHLGTTDERYPEFDRWLAEHDRAKDAEIARLRAWIGDADQ